MTFKLAQVSSLPHIAIISSGRPGNVGRMVEHLGRLAGIETWYVGEGEGPDYRYAGATNIVEAGGLAHSRNLALDRAFSMGLPCVQLDDDLTAVDWCVDGVNKHRITLERAIGLVTAGLGNGAYFAGAGATDNAFFMPKKDGKPIPISEHALIVSSFSAVAPNPIRFDENLRLKEDFGMTIEHLIKYGKVARVNTVLAGWQHRTNLGGAVQYRTTASEMEAIAYLKEKYPGYIGTGRNDIEIRLVYPPFDPSIKPQRAAS
jgi:hypothetical protein